MNKIIIVNNKSEILFTLESQFVPEVGEYIWFDNTVANSDSRKVTGRVVDLNKTSKKFEITLIVE